MRWWREVGENEKKVIRCHFCKKIKEGVHLRSYNLRVCFDCFLNFFRKRVQETIEKFKMFNKEEKIAVAISGGKDSVALARVLKDLGYKISLFHINTNIKEENYAENSEKAVKEFAQRENLPLKIIKLEDEIGIDIKLASKISKKEICGICGMIKRYLLNREAKDFDVIVTGHTLDDEAASLLSSLIFWKEFVARQWPILNEKETLKRKAKPLSLVFEKNTELFCQILNLPYNPQPCPLRGGTYIFFKNFIHSLEKAMPSSVLNFYKGFLRRKKQILWQDEDEKLEPCEKCGYLTVAKICSFCRLKEKIERWKNKS